MKNRPGLSFKNILLPLLFIIGINFSALCVFAYQTVVLHYPDRDWILTSYERKEEEDKIVAQFVPRYDDKNNWVEMLVFESDRAAKKANEKPEGYIDTLISERKNRFGADMKVEKITTKTEDAVAVLCQPKSTPKVKAQCEIIRVTTGAESLVAVEYINRDVENFPVRRKIWQPILENAVVYYSYFRWNPIMNKAICVEL